MFRVALKQATCPALHGQIRHKFRKADIEMVLFEDVLGLGSAGDIIQSSLGEARNYLVPFGLGTWS
jgi:Ribosomal protein L9, N-terminal domain